MAVITRPQPAPTVDLDAFWRAYSSFMPEPDPASREAVEVPAGAGLFIVAGPGTGKTTCLTMRILKLVLVEGLQPRRVVATTFTVKAAAELRSRVLGRGFRVIQALQNDRAIPREIRDRLATVDINQVLTGTVDSLCETILRDWRSPGTQPPVVADEFVSSTLMLREGLLGKGRFKSTSLDDLSVRLRGTHWGLNIASKTQLLLEIADRRIHDRVDWRRYLKPRTKQKQRLDEALAAYEHTLEEHRLLDFAGLEKAVLAQLDSGALDPFRESVDALIVDEYQDTNLLQEQIYFAIADASNGALTVVGDDDQSLYRFRGATVELFSDFANRYRARFGRPPNTAFLKRNYRSTRTIVDFVSRYARLDRDYQEVRVAQKPALVPGPAAPDGLPVLAMFRDEPEQLAKDLAAFVHAVFRGRGYRLSEGERIEAAADGGDVGDCAFLAASVREFSSSGKPRLPYMLKQELRSLDPPIELFNPRGEDLQARSLVEKLGGLLLESIDPQGRVEAKTSGLFAASDAFDAWRHEAQTHLRSAGPRLRRFVSAWQTRSPRKRGAKWPRSAPVLDLLYGLVHFFPDLYDDPEGQLALEVFTRQLSAADQVGSFKGRVLTDVRARPDNRGVTLPERSTMELLRNFLGPIAAGVIGINEDLVEAFPRDRLPVLTTWQAKGLEFPLIVVDVASDFATRHHSQAFRRFPSMPGPPHRLEDEFRPSSPLGAPDRDGLDRAFDDLFRQHFVAYSRPQDILVLVGLTASLPNGNIENVGLGWDRTGRSRWRTQPPFQAI